jgi:hypothetical protein
MALTLQDFTHAGCPIPSVVNIGICYLLLFGQIMHLRGVAGTSLTPG